MILKEKSKKPIRESGHVVVIGVIKECGNEAIGGILGLANWTAMTGSSSIAKVTESIFQSYDGIMMRRWNIS